MSSQHRKLKLIFLSLCFASLSLFSGLASAKELANRLGVGFRNSFPFDLPSLSATYYPNTHWGLVGSLGVDTENLASKFGVQVGFRRIVFKEPQMNFFMGANLGMASRESAGQTDSGILLDGIVGSEFFLQGLESLGFNIETGIGVSNISKVRFRTLGDHFLRAGIVFYF